LAVHSAQSVTTRTFGGQLTTSAPAPARLANTEVSASNGSSRTSGVDGLTGAVQALNVAPVELTPEEQARQLRHRDVIERATILLQNDASKLTQFRNLISSFKNGAVTATALIDTLFNLFSDTSSNALGTLIREVADLYEDKRKGDSLRTAWNDWRAINEDYPSLPAPTSTSGSSQFPSWVTVTSSPSTPASAPSAAKSNRVLKLKSSTAQSSRSSVSQTRSWGGSSSAVTPSSSSSSNAFPNLPPAPRPNNTNSRINTVPWAPPTSSSNPSSAPASAPVSAPTSRTPSRAATARGSDVFPALPPATKPQSTIFGYGTGAVRRNVVGGNPSSFAWGQSNGNGNTAESSAAASENEGFENAGLGQGGKKKGNKGKKQVLKWGDL